jgi:hypothetical protein
MRSSNYGQLNLGLDALTESAEAWFRLQTVVHVYANVMVYGTGGHLSYQQLLPSNGRIGSASYQYAEVWTRMAQISEQRHDEAIV